MLKLILLFMISTTAYAQQCPDLGWVNSEILKEVLIQKSAELLDVEKLSIDTTKEIITYKLVGSEVLKLFHYKTCGEMITFSTSVH